MKNTKLSLLRNFGTEQFSITIECDTPESVIAGIDTLNASVFKMLQDVENRGVKEREVLAHSAELRTMSINQLNDALKIETEAKKNLSKSVEKGVKNFNKTNK